MSLTYATSVINNRLQQVINAIDGGPANGKILIGTTGMGTVLSTVVLTKPSATISSGVLTFSATPISDPSAANTGTAAAALITNSCGTTVVSCLTVGLAGSGSDFTINLLNVTAGSIVTFQSGTVTGH